MISWLIDDLMNDVFEVHGLSLDRITKEIGIGKQDQLIAGMDGT